MASRKQLTAEYGQRKERARRHQAAQAAAGQDIAPLPPVHDPARRAAATASFRVFCETYFPEIFYLPWSGDHLRVIAKIERTILQGDQLAHAMPRGSGKSALSLAAGLWAILPGHRRFVVLIMANAARAQSLFVNLKIACETNDLLLEDFPEVLYPVHRLERISNRAKGQKHNGEPTYIEWGEKRLIFPSIHGSPASGAVIVPVGLDSGNIRGQQYLTAGGEILRPDLAIVDDPMTRQSARSLTQCAEIEALLAGDVLGMAGPGKKISAILTCTVIRLGDVADSVLDRTKHPEWHGERTKLIYAMPSNERLWDEYARIRAESLQADGDAKEATAFYAAKHRGRPECQERLHEVRPCPTCGCRGECMDAGAVVAWPARHNPDELSAVQHAMNLLLRDAGAFWAEFQNTPLPGETADVVTVTPNEIAARTNGLARRAVPARAEKLTAYLDIHKTLIYWLVAAWDADFTGAIIDYGAHPDQGRPHFAMAGATRTLGRAAPGAGPEGALQAGLKAAVEALLRREFLREDGAILRIERCLVDANWGQSTALVHEFCRRSEQAALLLPSHGKGISATGRPMAEYTRRPGDKAGHHWRMPSLAGKRKMTRYVLIDTNYWKSFIRGRLTTVPGDAGALTLFGRRPGDHRLLAEHLTSEVPVLDDSEGRKVDVWRPQAGRPDNHWLDCLVGCAVAASLLGVELPEHRGGLARAPKEKKRFSDLQRRRGG